MAITKKRISYSELTDENFPYSKVPPLLQTPEWIASLKVGDEVEVRAACYVGTHGRTLGNFPIERITPTGRVHCGGWIFAGCFQFGAWGPGNASIYPKPVL